MRNMGRTKLTWVEHIKSAIRTSNTTLHAIKIIRKYFNLEELRTLLTSLFYSKLYYGSEIWHTTGLNRGIQKSLKFASANALKICITRSDSFMTHTEIHKQARRAMPTQMCQYRHAINLYKLFKNQCPEDEFLQLNFQLCDNQRSTKLVFIKRQNYEVGSNILLNRLHSLNNLIEKDWMDLSYNSYKIKCKELFLK